MITEEFIKTTYPLHWSIWNNSVDELKSLLSSGEDIEKRDARGRTPLLLAVILGNVDAALTLLDNGASATAETEDGWSVLQEAVASKCPEMIQLILERRDYERHSAWAAGVPELLRRLNEAPDFYVEMKWEFTSWVPLVSRMCPSDTYKVYKQGAKVRIDTTLLGFDQDDFHRGDTSYVFHGSSDSAILMEIDHERQQVAVERLVMSPCTNPAVMRPSESAIRARMSAPLVTTRVDTDNITFERNKSGLWGWRSDKMEDVAGHECKVFSCSNVALVTKTRVDHLGGNKASRSRTIRTPLHAFLGMAVQERSGSSKQAVASASVASTASAASAAASGSGSGSGSTSSSTQSRTQWPTKSSSRSSISVASPSADSGVERPTKLSSKSADNLSRVASGGPSSEEPTSTKKPFAEVNVSALEYFDETERGKDIGGARHFSTETQKFKATLWLCEDYPLAIQEQIMPVVDLMAIFSPIFAKLKSFIQMQLPAGFPVKIEIPLFRVLNARITFGNIYAKEESVRGVTYINEADWVGCVVDDSCFVAPASYKVLGSSARPTHRLEENDEWFEYAIQQSLAPEGSQQNEVDIWEALQVWKSDPPVSPYLCAEEDRELQRAIQASLTSRTEEVDPDLAKALHLSKELLDEEEKKRQQEEQDMLQKAIHLSLSEQ